MPVTRTATTTGNGTGTSVATSSWTPGSNELVLVAVVLRDETVPVTLAGNGLTFVEIFNIDNVQGQLGLNVFRAMGASPSTGAITATLTGNSTPAIVRAHAFGGVDTSGTNGSGAVEASNSSTGPDPDDDDMLLSVTTVTANAMALAFGSYRNKSFTVPGGETGYEINDSSGAGGDQTTLSAWYEMVVTPASTQLGELGDLSGNIDWVMAVLSIKPASGASANGAAMYRHLQRMGAY